MRNRQGSPKPDGQEPVADATQRRPTLLVVEDDAVTRSMIATYFAAEGFVVAEAVSATECRKALKRRGADLVFMDIQLPDGDGMTLAREIRDAGHTGIVFVTGRDSDVDRILGLELAGDDYVTKPVNLRELLARARALLRRRQIGERALRSASVLPFGPWQIDLTRRELSERGGDPVKLTRAEFDLLAALVQARGRPLGRAYLLEVISQRAEGVGERTVDVLVARLRRKLGRASSDRPVIATVTDIGYKLGVPVDETA